ncbi:unnamed protein product [Lupinus luteus]|uniref:Uncharacterized protein n=1 Tax=Lupinus luteus TaxID=3873 RepID=A0AAV1WP34_LUPLU
MAKAQTLFLLLMCSSLGVLALEPDTILPHSQFLFHHAHPPHHHHHLSHKHPLSPTQTLVYPPNHPYPYTSLAHPPHYHHHSHSPAKPPTHCIYTTTHAPTKPPPHHIYTPSPPFHPHPPSYPFPASYVVVQGVVYTKSCKHVGADNLLEATALFGAAVKLQCNITKKPLFETVKTNKNGYFYIIASKSITTKNNVSHNCKVFLVSAPKGLKPSDLNGGIQGETHSRQNISLALMKLVMILKAYVKLEEEVVAAQ